MSIRELLYAECPYKNYPIRDGSIDGWNSRHPKLGDLLRSINPKLVLEIGSWKGASALFMSENTDAHIICLDTFLGAAEMWTNHADPERYGALRLENGFPTVIRDFMSNVIRAGKQDQITPMPMPSSIGLKLLFKWNMNPELIYVDGSHDFDDVLSDIKLSMCLGPRILCGDDFGTWDGVTRAVQRWIPDANKEHGGFWWLDMRNRMSSPAIE